MGLTCAREGPSACEAEETVSAPVMLNVYDLGPACGAIACSNKVMRPLGAGIYHCGVEVYDEEWSFAEIMISPADDTGVFVCAPHRCKPYSFKESIQMGMTSCSKSSFLEIIAVLEYDWLSKDYDFLKHNCCHFCNSLCQHLGVGTIPEWVINLANLGNQLRQQKCVSYFCCSGDDPRSEDVDTIDGRAGKQVVSAMPVLSPENPSDAYQEFEDSSLPSREQSRRRPSPSRELRALSRERSRDPNKCRDI